MDEKLTIYADMLRDATSKFNLVAPSTLSDIETRHFKDSAQLASILPAKEAVHIYDMGSGGGFPGVVLAIMGFKVSCIESIGKKAGFLKQVKERLGLDNLEILHNRVENVIKTIKIIDSAGKNKTNIFTARAFAPLIRILDYVFPAKCDVFLLKGREIENEISTAKEKFNFDYTLYPSKTGDGFMIKITNIKRKKQI